MRRKTGKKGGRVKKQYTITIRDEKEKKKRVEGIKVEKNEQEGKNEGKKQTDEE